MLSGNVFMSDSFASAPLDDPTAHAVRSGDRRGKRLLVVKRLRSHRPQWPMNVDLCGMGSMMPPGGMLPAADIQTMADWICSGAPNN
jgi:hypothetical protein